MISPAILLFTILAITIGMFLFAKWRHDMIAMAALLACCAFGLVSPSDAFIGFSHPAVVTVACVLVLSAALQQTGAVDVLAERILPAKASPSLSIIALIGLAALLSSFMNNVGALALLMPISLQMAKRLELPPGRILMPLAFATMLGGMTTLIGTPSNLVVSSFRTYDGHRGFSMFDFTAVGVSVAVVGVLFLAFIGWRLVPVRTQQNQTDYETGAYLTEALVPEDSKAIGTSLSEAEQSLENAQILGLIRNQLRFNAPDTSTTLRAGDVLLLEADPTTLATSLERLGLNFNEDRPPKENVEAEGDATDSKAKDQDIPAAPVVEFSKELHEFVVLPGSSLLGRSAADLQLRNRFRINLLAISRQNVRSRVRLRRTPLRTGDVLLVQGPSENVSNFAASMGCAPLISRPLRVPSRQKMWLSVAIMLLAIIGAASGYWSSALFFALGVLLLLICKIIPARSLYQHIDWSVIVLLGALIPVGFAMEHSGAAAIVADFLLQHVAHDNAILALVVVGVATLTLSDLMNNSATAAVMSPIAIGTAQQLGVNPDTFLMAIAMSASCAFLTPIAHQNNTLILGPGGFKFGDYWPLGLPLEILVMAVGLPIILLVWPL